MRRTVVACLTGLCLLGSAPRIHAQAPVIIGGIDDAGVALDRPVQALLVGRGIVVIAEEKSAPFLKVLSSNGVVRQRLGKFGEGPGEFRYVSALAYDSVARRLAVFDPMLRRVSFFAVDDGLTFLSSAIVPLHVTAACYLRGALWVHGDARNAGVVHRLTGDRNLTVAQSAGMMATGHPLDGAGLFRHFAVSGPLACDESTGSIFAATTFLGIVQIVDATTGTSRLARLADFAPLHYAAYGAGIAVSQPDKKNDAIIAIAVDRGRARVISGRADQAHDGQGDFAWVREYALPGGSADPVVRRRSAEVSQLGTLRLCLGFREAIAYTVTNAPACP
jgi:hypothetical protein